MRWDFFLPAALVAALAVMGIYAAKGPSRDAAELEVAPVQCTASKGTTTMLALDEASGLTVSRHDPQLMWSHNDSGEPVIYAVSLDGEVRGRSRLAGASVADWEAITTGPCAGGTCLYVADIGDNAMARGTIVIYRAAEPAVSQSATAPVETFEGVYPEGPQDAEAIFMADGVLHVVTKGEKTPIRVYRFPTLKSGSPVKLELVASITSEAARKSNRVTDAAISPDQAWVAMRTNDRLFFFETAALLAGNPGTPLSYDLTTLEEPQGEGIAWADAKTIYLVGEGPSGGTFSRVSCNLPS